MKQIRSIAVFLLLVSFFTHTTSAQFSPPPKRHTRTAAIITGLNLVVWGYDRYLQNQGWTRVHWGTWKQNVTQGFIWDHNYLTSNQVAHPYHGSLYFGVARANGFGYWGSMAYTAAGSLMWEYFFETFRPSFNDFINTTTGGAVLGEALHRIGARSFAGNQVRLGGLLGGSIAAPALLLGRLTGMSTSIHPTLVTIPITYRLRTGIQPADLTTSGSRPALATQIEVAYGSLFRSENARPFDAFNFVIHLNTANLRVFDRIDVEGLLYSWTLASTMTSRTVAGLFQRQYYLRNPAFEYGDQRVGMGLANRTRLLKRLTLETAVHLDAILLGSTPSALATPVDRRNDYGPGVGARFASSLHYASKHMMSVVAEMSWLHDVTGSNASHFFYTLEAVVDVPVFRTLGGGVAYQLYAHSSTYANRYTIAPHHHRTRVFISWHIDR